MQCLNARSIAMQDVFTDTDSSAPKKFQLLFEDGVILETTRRKTLYSHYFWRFHREYPKLPISSRHHVDSVLKGEDLNSNTHIELHGIIYKDCCQVYQFNNPEQTEHLLGLIYAITNSIYCEVSKLSEKYVTSLDILDLIEVVEHPMIKEANDNTQASDASIKQTYRTILNVLTTEPTLNKNAVSRAVRSKMVNPNQLLQCVSKLGFRTEVDGSILRVPVMSNFTKGMNTLYDFVAESRSAAKALYFSETPLKKAEYFARRLQLLCMTVEKIRYHDCGSTQHVPMRICPPVKDENGKVVYQGDLRFMYGKYYLDETTNQYLEITHDDPALYNRVLQLRSPLYCKTPNPHEICEVCFGALSKNISRFANIGHLCSATMTQQTSQSVLSTKHLDASSVSLAIILSPLQSRFFTSNPAKNAFIFKKEFKDKQTKIVINRDEAIGLTDIINFSDITNINPARISSVSYIDVYYRNRSEEVGVPAISMSQDNRRAIMSLEFLDYLKTHKWKTDNRNNFVFSLDNWDFSLPMFKFPEMEYSFSDHSSQIEKIIESNMKNIVKRSDPMSPVSTLHELFMLVNSKLNVNIAALEVIIYATMIRSKDDYRLGRNVDRPILGVSDVVIKNRSLSSAYAYEKQTDTITSPKSFYKLKRPDSVFDVFVKPREVIENYRNRK